MKTKNIKNFLYLPKSSTDTIESDGVYAWVDEWETKSNHPDPVPKQVVMLLSVGIVVKPDEEYVGWKEAESKDHHEWEYHFCHLHKIEQQ